jgi:hypothetical protein
VGFFDLVAQELTLKELEESRVAVCGRYNDVSQEFPAAFEHNSDCPAVAHDDSFHLAVKADFAAELERFAPQVALDMRPVTEQDARTVMGALKESGYPAPQAALAALKAGFSPVDETEIDWLENEALARGWRGAKWHRALQIADNPNVARSLERLRLKLVPPFDELARRLASHQNQPTGAQLAEALRDLWGDLNVERVLQRWTDENRTMPLTRPADTLSPSDGERDGVRGWTKGSRDLFTKKGISFNMSKYRVVVVNLGYESYEVEREILKPADAELILAPNDGTARAIADAFAADKDVKSYFVTGQDAEKASVQYIIDGKQSMTVFKDVRTLAADAVAADLLDAQRKEKGLKSLVDENRPAKHIATAAARGLGEGELSKVDRIEV